MNFRRVLDRLACPECRGPLRENGTPPALRCCACGAPYRIEEGIPILLVGASGPAVSADQTEAGGRGGLPTRVAHRLRAWLNESPGRDRHQAARLAAFVSAAGDGDLVMDLGSGSRRLGDRVLAVDIGRFPQVDLVADGHRLPFLDGVASRIVCTGVLEHVQVPERVVGEMVRVLRPGGRIYAAVPFLQGFHPGSGTDADFQRRTHLGLIRLMTPLAIVEWGIAGGPSAALAWVLREYLALPFAWSRPLYKVVYLASGPLTCWLRWLDVLLDRFPQACRIACGFYVIAERTDRLG